MTARNNKGFALLELIAIIAVVGLVAFAGAKVYSAHKDKSLASESAASSSDQQAQLRAAEALVPQVKTASDLDRADQALEANDPGASDVNDNAQLDKDINDL